VQPEDRLMSQGQLQEYRGWSRGAGDWGRAEAQGEPLPRDRTPHALGQRGPAVDIEATGYTPPRVGRVYPPSNRGRPACSGPPPSRSNAARPQPV
jgi:hypothetical protein